MRLTAIQNPQDPHMCFPMLNVFFIWRVLLAKSAFFPWTRPKQVLFYSQRCSQKLNLKKINQLKWKFTLKIKCVVSIWHWTSHRAEDGEDDDDDNDYSRVGSATHFFDGLHLRRSLLLRLLCPSFPSPPSLHPSLFFDRNTIQIPIHPFAVLLTRVQ